jgi:predicted DNA-binding transcriptional regulator AlpA
MAEPQTPDRPAPAEDKLFTLSEISQRTGISMPTLQRYKKTYQDRIPSAGTGRKQRYPEHALPVFEELRRENASKRGRPRKNASAVPATRRKPAAKRPAGRPRGGRRRPRAGAAPGDSVRGAAAKRRPGRPRGAAAKRRPGRPRGAAAKRRPGRPRGAARAAAPRSARRGPRAAAGAARPGRPRKAAGARGLRRGVGRPPGRGLRRAPGRPAAPGRPGRRPGPRPGNGRRRPLSGRRRAAAGGRRGKTQGLLTLTEISKTTGISYPTLVRYVRLYSDRLPHAGKGRARRFYPEAVGEFRSLRQESGRGGRRPGRGAARRAGARRAGAARRGRPPKAAAGTVTGRLEKVLARRIRDLEKFQRAVEKRLGDLVRGLQKLR